MAVNLNLIEKELISRHLKEVGSRDPINVVLEAGKKLGQSIEFAMLPAKPCVCSPTFECILNFGGTEVYGKEQAKIKSKRDAACKLIALWKAQLNFVDAAEPTAVGVDNPIGQLSEYCAKRGWSTVCDVVKEEGEPHRKQFTVRLKISGTTHEATSKGNQKKGAKKDCAKKLLETLGLVNNRQEIGIERSPSRAPISMCQDKKSESKLSESSESHHQKSESDSASDCEPNIVDITDETLSRYTLSHFDFDICKFQNDIIETVVSGDKDNGCQVMVILKISTPVKIVTHGIGVTSDEARKHAYISAVDHLDVMKKWNTLKGNG